MYGDPPIVDITRKNIGDRALMCCGIDRIEQPFINIGTLEMHETLSYSYKHARLNAISKTRADLLFKYGEDFGYGILLRSAFQFQSSLIKQNDITLHNAITEKLSHLVCCLLVMNHIITYL